MNSIPFTHIGILIYILVSAVDRFVWKMPDALYIPVIILGIVCMVLGIINARKK